MTKEERKEYDKEYYEVKKEYREANKDKLKEYNKEYREANKDKMKDKMKEYREANKDKLKEYYEANKDKRKEYNKEYREANKDKLKDKYKEYREANKDKKKDQSKEYYAANKDKRNEYSMKRYNNNSLYRLKCIIRCLVYKSMSKGGYKKNSRTAEILGCSFEEFKVHIQEQFPRDMTWDNSSLWHYDHIIPVASATSEEELLRLNHYTNFQPLWGEDNREKSAKLDWVKCPIKYAK